MKKLKTLIPLLIGLFIIIGGLTILNTQEAEARRGANCVFAEDFGECYSHSSLNCGCIVVSPPIK